ncbi:MAG TPA: hypothetical protein VEV64_07335, partial [Rhizomicrobium sp.]|nr:hypothetical protein [Rhizomicrobium sp.]
MSLTGKAKLAGVIGWPVSHSLSPVLHGHWLEQYGIDGAMIPLAARVEDFAAVIDGARRAGFKGVNVTVPHKESAFAIAHRADAAATAAGAANLLIFHDGEVEARNTDSIGLAESLRETIGVLQGGSVVLLGAGGAARGAILALEMLGAGKIHLLNRDSRRAANLAASLSPQVKAAI